MDFAERLKGLRSNKKLTQAELGKALGLSKNTIYQYESGKRKPDFQAMTKIEKFFGVSASYLRGEVDENDYDSVRDELSGILADYLINASNAQSFLRNLPQEECLEAFTALDILYLLISNPRIKQDDYLFYIQTLAGTIAELHRFVEMMGKATPDKSFNLEKVVNSYFESIKKDLFGIAELYGFARNTVSTSVNESNKIYMPLINIALTQRPGRISREPDKKRPLVSLEVLGEAAAGQPIMIHEGKHGTVQADEKHAHNNAFLVHVQGDSMTGAGINDGDYVVIRPQPVVENGEIALVGVNLESTIKYFYKHPGGIELRSANPAYEPYSYTSDDEVIVYGKVVDVIPKEKAVMDFS